MPDTQNSPNEDSVVIFQDGNNIELKVKLENDTVWLTQEEIAYLFNVRRPAITKHLTNIFKQKELEEESVSSILEHTAMDSKVYKVRHYNLDAIISVGYRVNSGRATQFRIWANRVLKSYIVEGYAINKKRLELQTGKLKELQVHLSNLKRVAENESFTIDESKELMRIIADYAGSLELIDRADRDNLSIPRNVSTQVAKFINYEQARREVDKLREELNAGELFGNEKDDGFKSAIANIFQTFNQHELYKSIEEKAANLLYLIIKNHPFIDGNKRIGAFMFVRFLAENDLLYKADGSKSIAQNALTAMALLIAQSDDRNKELMVRLMINLISGLT